MTDATTFVYRLYDDSKELLYIGITANVPRRLRQHERYSHWWRETVYIHVDKYANRDIALEVERRAIKIEMPIYNFLHNRLHDEIVRCYECGEPVLSPGNVHPTCMFDHEASRI